MSAKQVPLEVIPIGAEHGEDKEDSEAELVECESLVYTPSIPGPDDESLPHSPASLRSFELVENAAKGELVDSDLASLKKDGLKYSEAVAEWDQSLEKKQLLGSISLPELKKRRFVDRSCKSSPWA